MFLVIKADSNIQLKNILKTKNHNLILHPPPPNLKQKQNSQNCLEGKGSEILAKCKERFS